MKEIQYKLLATDMDGTLLDDEKEISDENKKAIREMIDAGYVFALSTGRPICAVEKYVKELELTGPAITYNGAKIVKANTGEVLYEQNMEYEDSMILYRQAKEWDVTYILWCEDQLYANKVDDWTIMYGRNVGRPAMIFDDFEALAKKGITKLIWIGDKDQPIYKKWYEEGEFVALNAAASQPFYLEFFSLKTSKAKAMERLGKLFGVKQEEMIACGDMYNDWPMIEYAGIGAVMKNGAPDMKEIAQYVTERDNNHSGVAEVIYKFILK